MDVNNVEYAIETLWRSISKSARSGVVTAGIPFYLQYMLFRCGYDTVLSFASESRISESFEVCMKKVMHTLKQEVLADKLDVHKYMGLYQNVDTFSLLPGHRALLEGLVQFIKADRCKQEIRRSLKMTRRGSALNAGHVGNLSAEKRLLDRSLMTFITKKKIPDVENFNIYLNADGRHGGDKRWPQAQVACPKCGKRVTVYRDRRRRRWNISRLTTHIQQHYHRGFRSSGHCLDHSCVDTDINPRSKLTMACRSVAPKEYHH